MLKQIISGGQTGADRAALDAALEKRFPVGGFCPKGRAAEDGSIPGHYPLEEIEGGYRQRTKRNLEMTDGTAIFYERYPTGGTELTLALCIKAKRPYQLLDTATLTADVAVRVLRDFIVRENIEVLNVAGPRASSSPGIYNFVRATISKLLGESLLSIQ